MPDWTREIRGRLSMVRLSPEREAEVVEELNAHLEERWRELIAGGASQDEATRTVRAELAASDMLARRISALRQARWVDPAPPAAARAFSIDGLKADLRQAIRTLRSSPELHARGPVGARPRHRRHDRDFLGRRRGSPARPALRRRRSDRRRRRAVRRAARARPRRRGFRVRRMSISATPRPSTWFGRRTTWTGSAGNRCSSRWPQYPSPASRR